MKGYHDIISDGSSNVAAQVASQHARLGERLGQIRHVVAIMSGKGGVGKSVMAVSIATALAQAGHRTGLIDADLNGASLVPMTGVSRGTRMLPDGLRPALTVDGVQVMSIDLFLSPGRAVEWNIGEASGARAWRGLVEAGALREMLTDTAWESLDVLVVDLPPGTDKLPDFVSLVPNLAAAVVITVPSAASTYVVRKSIEVARTCMAERPIFVVENMSGFECPSCGATHRLFADETGEAWDGSTTLIGRIPFDPDLSRRIDSGQAYLVDGRDTPAAAAIRSVANRLWQSIESARPAGSARLAGGSARKPVLTPDPLPLDPSDAPSNTTS